ncbi:hypothetical protein D3C73_1395360 [compost metagenome]
MVQQRQINVVFGVRRGDVGNGFGPCQRCAFLITEMVADAPSCQRIQFGLFYARLTQGFTVHFQTKRAAVDLRDPQVNQLRQCRLQRAVFQRFAGLNQSVIDFRAKFIIGLA